MYLRNARLGVHVAYNQVYMQVRTHTVWLRASTRNMSRRRCINPHGLWTAPAIQQRAARWTPEISTTAGWVWKKEREREKERSSECIWGDMWIPRARYRDPPRRKRPMGDKAAGRFETTFRRTIKFLTAARSFVGVRLPWWVEKRRKKRTLRDLRLVDVRVRLAECTKSSRDRDEHGQPRASLFFY